MQAPLRVSPSTLGNYFFLDCERMLRYEATPEERRQQEGVPACEAITSPVTEAIIARGRNWEELVVGDKLAGKAILGPGDAELRICDRVLSYRETISALQHAIPGKYLYQAYLEPPVNFYRQYGLNESEIVFSPCRPDLIRIGEGEEVPVRVTDIKASETTKFSHCVQTAMYALLLKNIVQAENIAGCHIDLEFCEIWLLEQEQPEVYDMATVIDPLETFLCEKLPKILLQPANAAPWSFSYRCEWCRYVEHCRREADERLDISLLPYFPPRAKYFLGELPSSPTTLSELQQFLGRDDAAQLFRQCASLVGQRERLLAEVQAMLSRTQNKKGKWRGGEVVPYGGTSISLPKGQNVGIVISLQQDPVTSGIFAAGLHIHGGKEIHGQKNPWTVVAKQFEQREYDALIEAFLEKLEQVMSAVHEYNLQRDWGEQKTLQCYVYDAYERDLLDELLADALTKPELARRALELFFYFQSERLADASRHASNEVPFPVIILTEVIRELVALPVAVNYTITGASISLKPEKYASIYRARPEFTYPISNKLRPDELFTACSQGDQPDIDQAVANIHEELSKRLKASFSILAGLRERLGKFLFAYPPKFFLPQRSDFAHATLSKLAFMTRYEQVLEYLEIHRARALSRSQRLESGNALRIELRKELEPGLWNAVIADESAHIIPDASGYKDWLLSADDEEGYRQQMSFSDFWYREQHWVPKKYSLCFAAIEVTTVKRGKRHLRLRAISHANSPLLQSQNFYLLHKRYTDFTSKRIIRILNHIDNSDNPYFLSLIEQPHKALKRRRRPKIVRTQTELANFLAAFAFTDSQKIAFTRILQSSHQLIWGPPGTGKTHFLGLTVLILTALAASQGKFLKILVTAFTHAAIENCLRMIARLNERYRDLLPEIVVGKLGGWKGQKRPPAITDNQAWHALPEMQQIVGCTIFSMGNDKYIPAAQKFDLVVIDEGSQLKVSEAALPVSRVNNKGGRLIIAGDDKQLGPIIKGIYSEPHQQEPALFNSIFECLRRADSEQNVYTSQLIECFRMNDVLCRFSAKTIYGPNYRPANATIAARRINLAPVKQPPTTGVLPTSTATTAKRKVKIIEEVRTSKVQIIEPAVHDDWLEWVISPQYPLVLLVLDGVTALAHNPIEAALVADMTVALHERLLTDLRPYANDEKFWRQGLFITSPHHIQIQAIHQELAKRKTWQHPPFIDTINKMQGQESDCAIVSYGVADTDYALREGEFIYSLNRLNVAITRARSKAIVCLPSPLLTPPLSAFGRNELIDGLDFMLKLRRFLLETGEVAEFPLSQGATSRIIAFRK